MEFPHRWSKTYLGIGLTTLATLLLELTLTRIFSVVFYYHFAFLAISIALFGLGAGGVFSYVAARWPGSVYRKLGWLAACEGVLAVAALWFVLTRQGEPGPVTVGLVYFTSALPFFAAGAVVSLAISESMERVNRVYFADLLGAAAGCLALVPLLDWLGGPNAVIAAAFCYTVSGVVWFSLAGEKRWRNGAVALSGAMLALLAVNAWRPVIDVRFAKGRLLQDERFVKWNSFSRIGVTGDMGSAMVFIDADASTGIPPFDFANLAEKDRHDLLYQGPGLPYAFKPGAKALIIGSGGGWDVARALASGSRDVTGVEINPIIANTVMREKFPHLSRNLYGRPEVRIVVEDGRSFVRRTGEKYQVIQATLVDTWASTAAGAFALSENNLYTTDAFCDYLSRLTPDGLLVFTRWGVAPPRESLRLISLAAEALERLGEREPWRNVLVVREGGAVEQAGWGAQDTALIARRPFTAEDLARFREVISHGVFRPVYLPDERLPNPFTGLLRSPDRAAFQRSYRYDISPVDDNRPFFFYTVQPRDLWEFLRNASKLSADYKINRAVPLLFSLLLMSGIATAVVLTLPRWLLGTRLPSDSNVVRFLWYFLAIGAGYILIQVALVQKFVLFLGHPTYALTVIIFSMLIASSLGSYFSSRIVAQCDARMQRVLVAIAVLVAALAFTVSPLLGPLCGLPLAVKFTISALLIAPVSFLMGIPFPTGLRRLEGLHSESVRWAWSLNSAASVLGSVSATVLAIYLGLRETLIVGGALYLVALVSLRASHRPAPVAEPEAAGAALAHSQP
jgi:predicted membrane-bound spermidine synthase